MDRPLGPCGGTAEHLAELVRTLQDEIIPRLVSARRPVQAATAEQPSPEALVGADEVAELAGLALVPDERPSRAYIESLVDRGVSAETMYLQLLAPAARHLGELWESDACDFTQVTVGLWRLQQIAHELGPLLQRDPAPAFAQGHRILLSPAPGEQHTLGIFMVSEFFLQAGWDVWGAPIATTEELLRLVREQWFDVVGLSSGCRSRVGRLASTIAEIRKASRNRRIGVMVGGPIFLGDPSLVGAVGADATAGNGRDAPAEAEVLLSRLGPAPTDHSEDAAC
ncbi:MAG: cobalamin B12-binding domain-containing protein [Rhodocyclaceae bacterium]